MGVGARGRAPAGENRIRRHRPDQARGKCVMKPLRAYRVEGRGGVADRHPARSDETVEPGTAGFVNREFAAAYQIHNAPAPDAWQPSVGAPPVFLRSEE